MSDITIEQLTNSTNLTDGDGVFDILMTKVEAHLEHQWSKGRLKGTDYATVYLGSIQSVLSESIRFLLTEEKAGYDADLSNYQAAEQLADTDRNDRLIDSQIAKNYAETAFTDQRRATEEHETGIKEYTKDTLIISQNTKVQSEISLLDQKILTEEAQTKDNIGAGATAVTGQLGKQKELYDAQIKGFMSKNDQGKLKLMLDTWTTMYAINDGDLPVGIGVPEFLRDNQVGTTAPAAPYIDAWMDPDWASMDGTITVPPDV